jgi:hypothetical protein
MVVGSWWWWSSQITGIGILVPAWFGAHGDRLWPLFILDVAVSVIFGCRHPDRAVVKAEQLNMLKLFFLTPLSCWGAVLHHGMLPDWLHWLLGQSLLLFHQRHSRCDDVGKRPGVCPWADLR